MPARSHVDFCLFVQILEVEEDRIPHNLRTILLAKDRDRVARLSAALSEDARRLFVNEQTNLHESIHIVQSVIYPFLYWNSMLILDHIVDAFKDKHLLDLKLSGAATSIIAPALHFLELKHYFWTVPGIQPADPNFAIALSLSPEQPKPNAKLELRLNAIDLVENAASLMQFKIATAIDFPSWKQFDRWSKRNPAYTDVIDFVGHFLGDHELALRVFCSLVQVAFETNQPVRAFTTLLGAFHYNRRVGHHQDFVDKAEPVPWMGLFDRYLSRTLEPQSSYGNLLSNEFFRIDRNIGELLIGGELRHPIMGTFAQRWSELLRRDSEYRYAFSAPNGYRNYIQEILSLFTAPISLLKLTVNGANTVVVTGDMDAIGIAGFLGRDASPSDVRALFVDILTMYGYTRRMLGTLMDEDFRFCHHKACPLYNDNLCNTWIFIPPDYESCSFKSRIEKILNQWAKESEDEPER